MRLICWIIVAAMLAACSQDRDDGGAGAPMEAPELEIVAALPTQPGNIAVGPKGRIVLSLRPSDPADPRVVELMPDGALRPFPNTDWNRPVSEAEDRREVLASVLGVQTAPNGVTWMLDNGFQGGVQGDGPAGAKLVGWNTASETLQGVFLLDGLTQPGSFLNDLAVDAKHKVVYIADSGQPGAIDPMTAIIVVNLQTGTGRRVLVGDARLAPENVDIVVEGKLVQVSGPDGPRPLRYGLNPITIDPDYEWVYFGAMSGEAVYRITTADLLNPTLSAFQIGSRVELYGVKPVSDGVTIDGAGNVYVTDINSNSIGVTAPDGAYRPLITDLRLKWPNSLAFGPDNNVYVTVSQMHLSAQFNGGEEESAPPYYVLRFPALADGAAGR